MTDELKPCPFCGGNNLKSGGDDKTVGTWCLDCQATGPNHYGEHEWNTRAPVPDEAEIEHDLVSDETIAKLREQLAEKYDISKGKLTPIEEPRAPVRVKKLVWASSHDAPHGIAFTPFDQYVIDIGETKGRFCVLFGSGYSAIDLDGKHWFDTPELAEAAAQADFERRVKECLE